MTVIVRLLHGKKRRALQPIGEAEAYARCHGDRSTEILGVRPMPPSPAPSPPPPGRAPASRNGITGETLRRAFEERLRSRS